MLSAFHRWKRKLVQNSVDGALGPFICTEIVDIAGLGQHQAGIGHLATQLTHAFLKLMEEHM